MSGPLPVMSDEKPLGNLSYQFDRAKYVEPKKRFPGTDIPDEIMFEVGMMLTGGEVDMATDHTVHQVAARVLWRERERCARLVETFDTGDTDDRHGMVLRRVALALRAAANPLTPPTNTPSAEN